VDIAGWVTKLFASGEARDSPDKDMTAEVVKLASELAVLLKGMEEHQEALRKNLRLYRSWLIFLICMMIPTNLVVYGILEGWEPMLIISILGLSVTLSGAVAKFYPD
jgi:hypothetical protein